MQRSLIETIMGAVVLIVAGLFLYLAYQTTDIASDGDGYTLVGRFGAVDGLTLGSDVRIGGVKVGTVTKEEIDPELYQAVVTLTIEKGIQIPKDTTAAIASDGLLGGQFVKLTPGRDDTLLTDGEEILDTKDVVAIEDLLGRAIFLITDQ
ncbi:MAG TPA: outer membrane lipid asymmetry maintenance protein MlaD [Rhodospirillaceae bacterium]|nr:outer membrane lipid asymmetry maintenance protein MlaD [Rhodospirillaceae bacterium]MAX60968.1 outer membrane lipid asymmetry maintenance protein MlaD [Rhodospirillaceae bacterium]MAX65290.1 outer membrane lipid asymmetry maintenance protein MlaD [Rhodospirillaceae bacterium]MBB55705.1 outer membrane lipid asymmetry maintenance protein MlaD [Rhodospirillaceae bacterium]HAE00786.1 outer membrane lipid asymmetry maintenance protein MlaD [Rhodospirillaceae bacterium]|tara:strand:+ start:5896 stop:6345 length:450 start_codon:yes stop_codon:yes gene_type:complete